MRKLGYLALLLLPLLVLYGCGSSSSGSSGSSSQETGSMTFSAKFPQSGKAGEIGSAFISNATQCIEVYVMAKNLNSPVAVLTPSSPTATVAGVPVGLTGVTVKTYDGPKSGGYCSGNMVDQLTATATVAVGSNTFTATMIGAGWQFASAIPLNKTLSNSTESATAFIVNSLYYGAMGKAAINDQKPNFRNDYGITWVGNFVSMYNGTPIDKKSCDPSNTACSGDDLHYYVQFIGPNTSNNAVDNGQLQLLPAAEFANTINYGYGGVVETNRFAFFFGIPFGFDFSNTISWGGPVYGGGPTMANTPTDPDAIPDMNALATTKVTGANTMSGNIVEVLLKDWVQGTTTCTVLTDGYTGTPVNQVVTCPVGISSKKVSKEAINKAVLKATSNAVGKAATIGSDGCFTEDVTIAGVDRWTDNVDVWDGSLWQEGQDGWSDQVLIESSWTGVAKICSTSFNATATEQNIVLGIQ